MSRFPIGEGEVRRLPAGEVLLYHTAAALITEQTGADTPAVELFATRYLSEMPEAARIGETALIAIHGTPDEKAMLHTAVEILQLEQAVEQAQPDK